MYTDDIAVGELLRLLLTFYLTAAIMAVGFGTMFAGGSGASAAARLFFLRPLQLLCGAVQAFFALAFGSAWSGLVALVARLGRALRRELKELAADVRWLVQRFDR